MAERITAKLVVNELGILNDQPPEDAIPIDDVEIWMGDEMLIDTAPEAMWIAGDFRNILAMKRNGQSLRIVGKFWVKSLSE